MNLPDGDSEEAVAASGVPVDKSAHDPAHESADESLSSAMPSMRELIVKSIGGWWGLFDSTVPVVAFVLGNIIGGLSAAIYAGAGVALIILGLRLARKQSPQQVLSGFFGVAVCILIAKLTGQARGFFLVGIWRSALMVVLAVGSVAIRRPLTGVIWEMMNPSGDDWRSNRRLVRTYSWTTLMWGVAYAGKFVLERHLYDENSASWLGVVRIGVGYPMLIGLVLVTLFAVRRTRAGAAADPQ